MFKQARKQAAQRFALLAVPQGRGGSFLFCRDVLRGLNMHRYKLFQTVRPVQRENPFQGFDEDHQPADETLDRLPVFIGHVTDKPVLPERCRIAANCQACCKRCDARFRNPVAQQGNFQITPRVLKFRTSAAKLR